MASIVIIGGGLTGISTAYHLEQQGFYDYVLLEKESDLGGLCRTITQDGFTFDYTGHLLHINDPYFEQLIQSLFSIETECNSIARRSYIYSNGCYTHYPFQMNLYGLPHDVISDCIEGYVKRHTRKKPKSFHDWVEHHFGAGFARHFFTPFQEKLFAYDCRKITPSWTGRFVPQTSLKEIITGALAPRPAAVGYNANFIYPKKGGIAYWVNAFAKRLKQKPILNAQVATIDLPHKKVQLTDGRSFHFDHLVSTMPLPELLTALQESSRTSFKIAARKLLANSVVNFNLGINRSNISDKHWIYVPEHSYPFYRLGFPHNFSQEAAPKDHSSLYGECAFLPQVSSNYLTIANNAKKAALELLGIQSHEIVTEKIIFIKYAYVLYTFWRERHLPGLLNELEQEQIHSIGRYGAWKYSSMQEAVLDGRDAAQKIMMHYAVPHIKHAAKDRSCMQ